MEKNIESNEKNDLAMLLAKVLVENNLTISFAESCTGGLTSSLMTDIPGSSSYLMGSIVSYSNKAKHEILKVSKYDLEKFGAVSKQVATEMAIGVKALFNVDVGVSITGIAGPGGATKDKPVGLVYIAVIYNKVTVVEKCFFEGTRTEVKMKSARKAIEIAKKNIIENHKEKK